MLFIDLAFGKRKELDQSRKIGFCNWGGGLCYWKFSATNLDVMSVLYVEGRERQGTKAD